MNLTNQQHERIADLKELRDKAVRAAASAKQKARSAASRKDTEGLVSCHQSEYQSHLAMANALNDQIVLVLSE